jgi:glycosyltransferase involved in cell wall biosynthesis
MLSFLFIDTERVWRGGQDQLLALTRGLHQRGHRIHLMCEPGTLLETQARESGFFVYPTKIRSDVGLISLLRFIFTLQRVRPDVLAFNTPRAILAGTLASRLASVGVRIVFRRVGFPLRKGFCTRLKYTWGISCIVAISDSIRSQLQICGIPGSMIKIIYEGIDLSLYPKGTSRKQRGSEDPAVVGTVAHLSREKGLQYLIEAASLIPDAQRKLRFVIVGDGDCLQELEGLVHKKGLEDIFQFVGFHANVSQYLKTFDIFVLPSLSEGLSSAILEAMATSLPIVATEVGGIPELVKSGDNGLLVAPADPVSLARAIQHLADHPDQSQRMGMRGRERVEEQFTLERKILETEQLCRILVQGSGRSSRSAYA